MESKLAESREKAKDVPLSWRRGLWTIGLLWIAIAIADRLWFALDRSVPTWDPADYLMGSLRYWQALQTPEWLSGTWWHDFWQVRSKIPPLAYVAAALVQMAIRTGPEQATYALLLFSAVLLLSAYGLGVLLFSPAVGVWAAALCALMPGLYRFRLEFLLDYPLTAAIAASFCCLTLWRSTDPSLRSRLPLEPSPQASDGPALPSPPAPLPGGEGSKSLKPAIYSSVPLPPELRLTPRFARGEGVRGWGPDAGGLLRQWLAAIAFGLSLGLALLTKQPALFFLALPMLWLGVAALVQRAWGRLLQLLAATLLSAVVWWPWYSTNWFLMLTAGKRATIDSAAIEGDPVLTSLDAWTFYLEVLPALVSWPLLGVSLLGLVLAAGWHLAKRRSLPRIGAQSRWLLVFLVGGYVMSSLNVNKDGRYILPLLPVVAVVSACGLLAWGRQRWGRQLRWALAVAMAILSGIYLFPLVPAQAIASRSGLGLRHWPELAGGWPHAEVVEAAIAAEPYLQANIGVLPSTPGVNQHNVNYFGALQGFRVYGRQVGVNDRDLGQDARSMSWFLTKTGEQGSVPAPQAEMVQLVETGGEFDLQDSWELPRSRGTLKLYRRGEPFVTVEEMGPVSADGDRIRLESIEIPATAPPGQPVPVTYFWSGPAEQLQGAIVLLQWQLVESDRNSLEAQAVAEGSTAWLHDRGLGAGRLLLPRDSDRNFRVLDRTATLPPANAIAGTYTLQASYLNRATGESYPLAVPDVSFRIDPAATASPAPEVDLPTQLRQLASSLRQGDLDLVFREVGRINQYDPTQDYLEQAALALTYRLEQQPDNLDWIYALALARVQQQDVSGALAAVQKTTQFDPKNPYAHAYLAFVRLYQWKPNAAQPSIDSALALDPSIPEFQALNGVAALMRGNAIAAWKIARPLL